MSYKLLTLPAAVMVMTVSAIAADLTDADGDGFFSMEEMQAVYPELSAEVFTQIDVDADGKISADEVAAATEAGLLPAKEG